MDGRSPGRVVRGLASPDIEENKQHHPCILFATLATLTTLHIGGFTILSVKASPQLEAEKQTNFATNNTENITCVRANLLS